MLTTHDIAIIPARGGSKRIPRKNIRLFHGQPIIAYSIQAAVESGCFNRVVVSTDDDEIAAVAEKYGAEAPFRRPAELSNDFAPTVEVIKHAIETLESDTYAIRYACCLYATAPFVSAVALKMGKDKLTQQYLQFVFSATTFPFPIQRAIRVGDDDRVSMLHPEHYLTRSQDLEETYHDAGQFYWGQAEAFKANLPVFESHSSAVVLPRSQVQDIDTEEDWEWAEMLYAAMKLKKT